MGFSDEIRSEADHVWQAIFSHPFVTGIGDGSLAEEKFKFYICQDYLFLIDYAKVFAMAVTKPSSLSIRARFSQMLNNTLNVEMALHRSYCSKFGITSDQLENTKPAAATLAYTGYLLRIAYEGTLGELTAALLPCMWSYCQIGRQLSGQDPPEGKPLYKEWISAYSSPEIQESTQWMKDLLDGLAAEAGPSESSRMEEAFMISSKYEYLFWEMAFRMEDWPL